MMELIYNELQKLFMNIQFDLLFTKLKIFTIYKCVWQLQYRVVPEGLQQLQRETHTNCSYCRYKTIVMQVVVFCN